MSPQRRFLLALILAAVSAGGFAAAAESPVQQPAVMPIEDAWKALPRYEYGQDMAALLAIDRAVIQSMASPESRSACAARLAALLTAPDTTFAAKQYACLQLRQVGTPAEVPVLAGLLEEPETSEMARHALEAIRGEESLSALRNSLSTLRGKLLVGAINSVAAQHDAASVETLQNLAGTQDREVASAARWALGNIATDPAAQFLTASADKAGIPTPQDLAVPLLRCANAMAGAGKKQEAAKVYAKLSEPGQTPDVRRAAFEGLLRLEGEKAPATILAWFAGDDADRRLVALGHLHGLSNSDLDRLAARLAELPDAAKLSLIEVLASRRGKDVLPLVTSLAQSENAGLRLAGVRCLGMVGDASAIPILLDTLSSEGELAEAARQALCSLPRKQVGEALFDALQNRPAIRGPVIEALVELKLYEAIDPLIVIAAHEDPAVYGPALDGLRGIADPDQTDVPRLVKLLLTTPKGAHRDEVEKTILIVCDKLPKGADRAGPVLASLGKIGDAEPAKYLPLLGRLGGAKALKIVDSSLASPDAEVKEAAVRALCNWPNAEVADRLLDLASHSENRAFRQWALRAYVRVVSLESDRPEAQTLAMLQGAMKLAAGADDKQLVLRRTATVRTMEAVEWLAGYLDDPALAQAACESIVELAHHRFLRHPNMSRFGPILEKVSKVSTNADVVERAKRYRLGL